MIRRSRSVSDLSGYKTLVHPITENHEPHSVLPSPPNTRSKPVGKPYFNVPPGSDEGPYGDGRSLHKDLVRTMAVPGADFDEHPWVDNSRGYNQVRPDITAAMNGPPYPGTNKQKTQKGQAKKYYKDYYRKNRQKIKNNTKKWYRKNKTNPKLQRDKQRRRDKPQAFERKPSGGYVSNKERAKDNRKKAMIEFTLDPIPVWFMEIDVWGWVVGVDVDEFFIIVEFDDDTEYFDLEEFFDIVVIPDEDDIDRFIDYLDKVFEYHDIDDVVDSEDIVLGNDALDKRADGLGTMIWKPENTTTPPDQYFTRGDSYVFSGPEREPSNLLNITETYNNPGSTRVIPEGHDFVNKMAMKIPEIRNNSSKDLIQKSKAVRIKLKRVDSANLMWLFEADGSEETPYKIRVKLIRPRKNITRPEKCDVFVSCSCPFWRWQGPEYWAKTNDYLLGRPVGTAASPDIKDPNGHHWACKHILAVLDRMGTYKLQQAKTASYPFIVGNVYHWDVLLACRVASRYKK